MKSVMELPHFFSSAKVYPSQKDDLHTKGYQIIRNAVEIDERVLENVKKSCHKKTAYIFNHNETNKHNDHKRRQRNLLINSKYMDDFDKVVKQIIKEQVNTFLTPSNPVILHSKPTCQPQASHCDYIPDEALQSVSDEEMPLAVLIALMPNTKLRVWPHSCRLTMLSAESLQHFEPIAMEELIINPGDMIVFRGDFVHAGSGYEEDNYRIHYYLDSPLVPRVQNRTWLIEKSQNPELIRLIQSEKILEEETESKRIKVH